MEENLKCGQEMDELLILPLVSIVKDESAQVHSSTAINLLTHAGPAAKAAIPSLIAEFDVPGRGRVATDKYGSLLVAIGPDDPDVLSLLNTRLLSGSVDSYPASVALGELGPKSIPYFLNALDAGIVFAAARQLGQFGTAAWEAIPKLLHLSTQLHPLLAERPRPGLFEEVLLSMAAISPQDPRVLNFLTGLTQEDDPRVLAAAAAALKNINNPVARQAMDLALRKRDRANARGHFENEVQKAQRSLNELPEPDRSAQLRQQVFELVICYVNFGTSIPGVRWEDACGQVLQAHNITVDEVEAEARRRSAES